MDIRDIRPDNVVDLFTKDTILDLCSPDQEYEVARHGFELKKAELETATQNIQNPSKESFLADVKKNLKAIVDSFCEWLSDKVNGNAPTVDTLYHNIENRLKDIGLTHAAAAVMKRAVKEARQSSNTTHQEKGEENIPPDSKQASENSQQSAGKGPMVLRLEQQRSDAGPHRSK